jgi:hypothetical protein
VMVLGWVPFKIVADSPALHSRWLLLLKIEISSIVQLLDILRLQVLWNFYVENRRWMFLGVNRIGIFNRFRKKHALT